ncbi:TPA: GtrA family protein [Escherichia coli]|uniref:Putative membrane GtrA-like protein n=1 Tax=Escherichia coli TaxID=562 RepID=A0A0A8J4X7_ECOLX|nr:GtrA family protein [Escherichia coli]EFJ2251955.1 GtrA family protein [Escherichia coli]STJ69669.1 GtrA-like protein [Escherichia coli]BAQ01062.1 putative membrane GtrA-like protein [Escherichia coli]BEB50441.1 hypothetical protein VEE41_37620 [Escherichia coli]
MVPCNTSCNDNKLKLKEFIKYCIVGGGNTLFTVCVIFFMMFMGFGIFISNAIGYFLGIILSFVVNTKFTFNKQITIPIFFKFLVTCFFCYSINVFVIYALMHIDVQNNYYIQFSGMCTYTFLSFYINKKWSMK